MTSAAAPLSTSSSRPCLDPANLSALEARIEREIRRILRVVANTAVDDQPRGGDFADMSAFLTEREAETAVRERCANGLAEWNAALKRLRESPDAFGLCHRCRQPIPWARLELLPTTQTCTTC